MLVAFLRYAQGGALRLVRREARFLSWMAMGSVGGAVIGGKRVGSVPPAALILALGTILLISAIKIFALRRPVRSG